MDNVTKHAKEMYSEFRFGDFNYGNKRGETEPLLFDFLSMVHKNAMLFDIGCGVGFWMDTYISYGISRENIRVLDLAQPNIVGLNRRDFKGACGSAVCLPFQDNVSDFTVCNGVIHHTADPFTAFRELVRITKPGGYIYLNVYNIWNPYYYIVHKATLPLRYVYWNWSKKIVDILFPLSKVLYQPLAYLTFGRFLDEKTAKTMFMDQVITPRASLFSKSMIRSYAASCSSRVQQFAYNKKYMMISAILKVEKLSS